MNCENANLKDLLEKAEKYDYLEREKNRYKEKAESYKKTCDAVCKFFERILERDIYRSDLEEKLSELFDEIADEKKQGFLLAKEREHHNEEFQNQMYQLQKQYEYKADELVLAWEKFRAIKTAKHQKTIDEINAEKI